MYKDGQSIFSMTVTSVSVDEVSTNNNRKVVFKHLVSQQLSHFWVIYDCVATCHSPMMNVVRAIPIPPREGATFLITT